MYTLSGDEQLEEITAIPKPEAGAPEPTIEASEDSLTLSYYSTANEDSKVVIKVVGPVIHMFGMPNDEALHGHPLYERGLNYYKVTEVKNSGWINALEQINSVHDKHDSSAFKAGNHHYIFTFHDTTFECIAAGLELKK